MSLADRIRVALRRWLFPEDIVLRGPLDRVEYRICPGEPRPPGWIAESGPTLTLGHWAYEGVFEGGPVDKARFTLWVPVTHVRVMTESGRWAHYRLDGPSWPEKRGGAVRFVFYAGAER